MKMLDKYAKGGKTPTTAKAPKEESKTRKRFNKKFKKARAAGKETFKFRNKQFNLLEKRKEYSTELKGEGGKGGKEENKVQGPSGGTSEKNKLSKKRLPSGGRAKRKYVDGGLPDKKEKDTPVKLETIKPTKIESSSENKTLSKPTDNTSSTETTPSKNQNQESSDTTKSNVTLKPSERKIRRENMSDRERERLEKREQKEARKNRDTEGERMSSMTDRQRRKYANEQARNERKIERGQMRTGRREARNFNKTQRRAAREDARAARGMTYTGGRRISPRRWYKNLRDKLGLNVKQGEGRLKSGSDFRRFEMNPSYYKSESGNRLAKRSDRKGRYRSNEGTFDPTGRGSGQRYQGSREGLRKVNENIGNTDVDGNTITGEGTYNPQNEGQDVKKEMKKGGMVYKGGGKLKRVSPKNKGLKKLPRNVRNKMGYMKEGGKPKYPGGGKVPPGMGKYNKGGEIIVKDYKDHMDDAKDGATVRTKNPLGQKRKITNLTRQEKLNRKRNLNYRPQSAGPLPIPSRRYKKDKKEKKAMMGMISKVAGKAMGK